MLTKYQIEYYRDQSLIFIKDMKRQIDNHLCINKVNVYHVQAHMRKVYKQNRFINVSMSYGEYIEELFKDFFVRPEYMDVISKDVDYKLNTLVNPKIFFYDE